MLVAIMLYELMQVDKHNKRCKLEKVESCRDDESKMA